MEEQMSAKRRRTYPLEPNLTGHTTFARDYVNHLVPALMKIRKSTPLHHKYGQNSEIEQTVRYEVDMALVTSTPGFGWSQALNCRLHKNSNAGRFHDSASIYHHDNSFPSLKSSPMHGSVSLLKNVANYDHSSPRLPHANYNATAHEMKVVPSPNIGKSNVSKKLTRSRTKKEAAKQSEEEQIGSRFASLRSLLPGGNEMGVDDLFSEMGSYIASLQMQVNVLSCLVNTQS